MPKISISKSVFRFGIVEARTTSKESFWIKNKNERPISIEFNKSKNFSI